VIDVILTWNLLVQQTDPTDYAEACYRATTTLAFVVPNTVLPRVIEQLRADLSPDTNSLTDLDLGVWNTPEGQTFVDGEHQSISLQVPLTYSVCPLVLSNKGNHVQVKGKDADLAKWDAEVRESLAKKKSTVAPTLSKQEQALVQAQVEREAKIRSRVDKIKADLERGLQTVSYLALGSIEDFRAYVSQITSLLLNSGALDKGTQLVGSLAFKTFLVWIALILHFYVNTLSGGVKVLFRSARYI
jgi:hypothetical protein